MGQSRGCIQDFFCKLSCLISSRNLDAIKLLIELVIINDLGTQVN
jgi:hypothetical protein